jgi:hypothetical protein
LEAAKTLLLLLSSDLIGFQASQMISQALPEHLWMFCESESGWGEKLALDEGCGAVLCEPEVPYESFTKAIVALADTLVNKENWLK